MQIAINHLNNKDMKKYINGLRNALTAINKTLSDSEIRAIKQHVRIRINSELNAPRCITHINMRANGWTTYLIYN